MFKEMILKLRSALATLTLNDEQKKNIEDQIKALEAEAAKPPTEPTKKVDANPATLDEATKQLITSLEGQVKGLSDALGAETNARKEQADAMAARAKKEHDKAVSDFVDKMKKEGRMTPAQEERDKKNLEKDFDEWSIEIAKRGVNPAMKKDSAKPESKAADQPSDNYFKNSKPFIDAAVEELKNSNN